MPALIPLALSLAPEVAKWLFGSDAAAVTKQVTDVARAVTGTDSDDAAVAVLEKNPELATQLRVQLAQIAADREAAARAAELDALKASLADVANARAQTVDLAKTGSNVVWAPVVVSGAVLSTFGFVMFLALTRTLPQGSETILNMLLGTLAAMSTAVVSYWVGSSAGSAAKTHLLYSSKPADQ